MSKSTDKLETKLIHAAAHVNLEQKTGAVNIPIYLSSTYHQESFDDFGPYDYSRSGNPTRQALEQTIAVLENGTKGFAFASGMAAISSAFMLLSSGDHIVISDDVYGGTFRFVTQVLTKYNISHTFADLTSLEATKAAILPNTKLIFMETPANPRLNITDIAGVVKLAKANDALTFLDNTFMTPIYQQPIDLGVDVVLHSATKFLSGHSDIIAGLAVTKDKELGERLGFIQNSFGSILGAQDSFTLMQGMKTLGTRLHQSSKAAFKIATYLKEQPLIKEVFYPGFTDHPGYSTHIEQASGHGAVLSFRFPNRESTKIFVESVRLPIFAVSLGGVESILSYPTTMSHAAMPKEEREKRGITDGLLRLSVGLEHVDDLIADFEQALQKVKEAEKVSK